MRRTAFTTVATVFGVQPVTRDFLSARGRAALARQQREIVNQLRELQTVDRVLSGALSACDSTTQRESFENYLEAVQELRVSLQRLESFLLQKLLKPCGAIESLTGNDQGHPHGVTQGAYDPLTE